MSHFILWATERGLNHAADITRPVLARYQRHLYAPDTQHGRFEMVNPKNGKHLGEVDMGMSYVPNSIDKSGGHDLKVK